MMQSQPSVLATRFESVPAGKLVGIQHNNSYELAFVVESLHGYETKDLILMYSDNIGINERYALMNGDLMHNKTVLVYKDFILNLNFSRASTKVELGLDPRIGSMVVIDDKISICAAYVQNGSPMAMLYEMMTGKRSRIANSRVGETIDWSISLPAIDSVPIEIYRYLD